VIARNPALARHAPGCEVRARETREASVKGNEEAADDGTPGESVGRCACGAVVLAIRLPAFWAWHDHAPATRKAHGAGYATYAGVWRKRLRLIEGEGALRTYCDPDSFEIRSFCEICGTPIFYERHHGCTMVNVPLAIFEQPVGREPRYHRRLEEIQEWIYRGEPLTPLKGYPGIFRVRGKSRRRA
jgi:hypothetical protein